MHSRLMVSSGLGKEHLLQAIILTERYNTRLQQLSKSGSRTARQAQASNSGGSSATGGITKYLRENTPWRISSVLRATADCMGGQARKKMDH